mgnify:CR=1 FL=1
MFMPKPAPNNNYSGLKLISKVDVEVACRLRSHRLWNHFPRAFVTSSLANLCLIPSPCFELQILAIEPVYNSQVLLRALVRYTAITCIRSISNVPLRVTSPFAVEALSFRLRSRLGFFSLEQKLACCSSWSSPFFPLSLYLNLVVLFTINTWCFSWFLPSSISSSWKARDSFSSSLAYYSSSRSSTNLVMVTREFYQSLFYLED